MDFFLKGLLTGFYIALPVGAVCMIYLQRFLFKGKWSGVISALGVALGEFSYAVITIYGFIKIYDFIVEWNKWLKLFGVMFLLYFGVRIFYSKPSKKVNYGKDLGLISDFFSMYFLSLINPIAIAGFIAVFVNFMPEQLSWQNSGLMLFGFFCGSFGYCLMMLAIAGALKNKLDDNLLQKINKVCGVLIIIFAILIFSFSSFLETGFSG